MESESPISILLVNCQIDITLEKAFLHAGLNAIRVVGSRTAGRELVELAKTNIVR